MAAAIHSCPRATTNPVTKLPFCDKTIRKVFATECFDVDPENPCRTLVVDVQHADHPDLHGFRHHLGTLQFRLRASSQVRQPWP